MAFGFPAHYTECYHPKTADTDIREAVREALQKFSWSTREETSIHILASTSWNLRSWEEEVYIFFLPDGSISIISKCFMQCFDWGKNKKNVKRLLNQIRTTV